MDGGNAFPRERNPALRPHLGGHLPKKRIREIMRAVFQIIESESMEFIYRKIAHFCQIQLE
jgi:hypothetical protein